MNRIRTIQGAADELRKRDPGFTGGMNSASNSRLLSKPSVFRRN